MKKILKFSLGGLPGTFLNYIILLFFDSFLKVKGIEMVFISVIAFLLKEIISFMVHKWWTFEATGIKNIKREVISYTIMIALVTGANTIFFYIFTGFYEINPVLAQFIINIIFFVVNFPALNKIVFAKK